MGTTSAREMAVWELGYGRRGDRWRNSRKMSDAGSLWKEVKAKTQRKMVMVPAVWDASTTVIVISLKIMVKISLELITSRQTP